MAHNIHIYVHVCGDGGDISLHNASCNMLKWLLNVNVRKERHKMEMTISSQLVQLFGTCLQNWLKLFCRPQWPNWFPLTQFWGPDSKRTSLKWPVKDFWSVSWFPEFRPKVRHNSITVWATEVIFISNSIIFDALQFGILHLGWLGLVWAGLKSARATMTMLSWKYLIFKFFNFLSGYLSKYYRPPIVFLRMPRTIYVHQSQIPKNPSKSIYAGTSAKCGTFGHQMWSFGIYCNIT